jgi:hypothetical protein
MLTRHLGMYNIPTGGSSSETWSHSLYMIIIMKSGIIAKHILSL